MAHMLSTMWGGMGPSLAIISKIMLAASVLYVRKIMKATRLATKSKKVNMEVGNVGRMICGKHNMIMGNMKCSTNLQLTHLVYA